jgi:hypothetical protein
MSDTPRTDADEFEMFINVHSVSIENVFQAFEFARLLERELNVANERIKRLEEALDTLTCVIGLTPIKGNLAALQEAFDMARAVLKDKEAKL